MLKQQEKGETFYYDSIAFLLQLSKNFIIILGILKEIQLKVMKGEITNTFANAKGDERMKPISYRVASALCI